MGPRRPKRGQGAQPSKDMSSEITRSSIDCEIRTALLPIVRSYNCEVLHLDPYTGDIKSISHASCRSAMPRKLQFSNVDLHCLPISTKLTCIVCVCICICEYVSVNVCTYIEHYMHMSFLHPLSVIIYQASYLLSYSCSIQCRCI